MARGQKEAADANLATTNSVAAQQGAQSTQMFQTLWPQIQKMLNPDPATRRAYTQEPLNAVNSAFDAAQGSAASRVARTRNDAGFAAQEDDLAMKHAAGLSDASLKGTAALTDLQNKGVTAGAGLFNTTEDTMRALYGLGPSTLDARAAGGGWAQGFHDVATGISSFLKPQSGSSGS